MGVYLNANWPPILLLSVIAVVFLIGWIRGATERRRERRELVLDVIRAQQPNGTGFTITREVEKRTGAWGPIASVYVHLAELQRTAVVSSRWGVSDRLGGPRPRHYWITADFPNLIHDGVRP